MHLSKLKVFLTHHLGKHLLASKQVQIAQPTGSGSMQRLLEFASMALSPSARRSVLAAPPLLLLCLGCACTNAIMNATANASPGRGASSRVIATDNPVIMTSGTSLMKTGSSQPGLRTPSAGAGLHLYSM